MVPKTRLDRLVQIRARSEESALNNLARARSSLGRASERLAALRAQSRADDREASDVALWELEEKAHARTLQTLRTAEGELATAHRTEQQARTEYESTWRNAEAARKVQGKKREAIRTELERGEQRATDEIATMNFNSRG